MGVDGKTWWVVMEKEAAVTGSKCDGAIIFLLSAYKNNCSYRVL